MRGILAVVALVFAAGTATAETYRDTNVDIAAVSDFDLPQYLGRWYEIARFPNSFEKGCVAVTADYAMRDDGQVSVINTCRKGTIDGPIKTAKGRARVEGAGKLSVTFVPWLPFARGDYWVLYLDDAYSVAAIGAPKGSTGWILARSPQIGAGAFEAASAALARNGYDVERLMMVPQPDTP